MLGSDFRSSPCPLAISFSRLDGKHQARPEAPAEPDRLIYVGAARPQWPDMARDSGRRGKFTAFIGNAT